MRSMIIFPLLFAGYLGSAQTKFEYGGFIQFDNKIEWAMEIDKYLDLIPKIPNYSITRWYLKKLKQDGITAYLKNADGYSVTPFKLSPGGWKKPFMTDTLSTNETFNEFRSQYKDLALNNQSNCVCDTCYTPHAFDITKVKQILYYKDGKFNITNILLTPMCLSNTIRSKDEHTNVWNNLFNVAFNNNPSRPPSNNMIFIGPVEKKYNLSSFDGAPNKKLLTVKSDGIMHYLNRDFRKGLFLVNDPRTGKIITNKEYFTTSTESLSVAVYNNIGDIMGYKTVKPEMNPDSFYVFTITQDIYFDPKNEVLVSKVKKVAVMKQVVTSQGLNLGLSEFAIINYTSPKMIANKKAASKK